MALIQDVKPYVNKLPAYMRGYGMGKKLKHFRTDMLIAELYHRGISVEDIFGQYYAMEAIRDARDDEIFGNDEEGQHGRPVLTVGDAQLVTPTPPPKTPLGGTPSGEMPF